MPKSQVPVNHKAPSFGFLPSVGQDGITAVGNIFFVDSGSANAANDPSHGKRPDMPFSTIDYAVGRCTATNGDIIFVAPGHTETVSAAGSLDLDVAGIRVVGVGNGRDRPVIDFTTATTADVDVDAANITVENMRFTVTGVDAVAAALDVNAADFTLRDCEVVMADGTNQAVNFITTATAASRMVVEGCVIRAPNAGADSAILLEGTPDGVIIRHNEITGDFAVGTLANVTGNVATNVAIYGNFLRNDNNGQEAVDFDSAVTGYFNDNRLVTDAIATAGDYGAMTCAGNVYNDDGDTDSNGTPIPLAITTGGVSLDNIQDALYGADGITTWPSAAAPANGVSMAEALRYLDDAVQGAAGVVTFPTGAAAANGVSLAEVLRYTQENVITGTGTVLPANQSLYDVLAGTNGVATWAAAAAPANGVSIAEAVRYISEQQTIRYVTRAASVLSNGLDLFTVTGTVAIKYLYLLCATANDATASTIQFNAVPTVGSATTISAASASVANAAAGATITLAGTALATAALYAANGPNLIANPGTVLVPAGVIDVVVGVGSTTGTWSAHLVYEPLSAGASVAAA